MSKEIAATIKINTGDSQKTIKQLRDEVKDLREKLLNLDKTSEEYVNTVKQIASNQQQLSSVMRAEKETVTAAEGSYNALVQQMAQLKAEWRATGDEMTRAALGTKIDEINSQLKELDASVGNHSRNVGDYTNSINTAFQDYRNQIRNLRGELLGLEEGTDEYNAKVQELADLQFKLKDINETVSRSANDLGEKLATVTRVTGGLASGFGAVQGAMGLLGIESEDFDKTMVKLQSTIALVQGLQGLEGLTKDIPILIGQFKGAFTAVQGFIKGLSAMKAALVSTGIGALVVALGLVVANWDKLKSLITGSKDESEKYRAEVEKLTKEYDNLNTELDTETQIMQLQGKTELEIIAYKREKLSLAIAETDAVITQLEAKKRLSKEEKESLEELKQLQAKQKSDLENLNNKERVEQERTHQETLKQIEKEKEEKARAAEERRKKAEEALETERKSAEEIYNRTVQDSKSELQLLEEKYANEKAQLEKFGLDTTLLTQQYQKDRQDIIDRENQKALDKQVEYYNNEIKSLDEQIKDIRNYEVPEENWDANENGKIDNQGELETYISNINAQSEAFINAKRAENDLLQEQIKFYQELAKAQEDAGVSNEETVETINELTQQIKDNNDAIVDSTEKTAKDRAKITSDYNESEKKEEKDKWETIASYTSDALGAIGSFMKEGSAEAKSIAVAQAVINAALAVTKTIAQLGFPMAIPAIAATALITGAQIKQILDTKPSGENNDTSTSSPSYSSAAAVAPSISSSLPVTNTRNILGDEEIEELNRAQKVYVLESEISSMQKKVRVQEENSIF